MQSISFLIWDLAMKKTWLERILLSFNYFDTERTNIFGLWFSLWNFLLEVKTDWVDVKVYINKVFMLKLAFSKNKTYTLLFWTFWSQIFYTGLSLIYFFFSILIKSNVILYFCFVLLHITYECIITHLCRKVQLRNFMRSLFAVF